MSAAATAKPTSTDAKAGDAKAGDAKGGDAKGGGDAYTESIKAWRAIRHSRLTADNSWLTLCGLWFLEDGENAIGSDDNCKIKLPAKCGKAIGSVHYAKATGKISFTPSTAAGATAVTVAGVSGSDAKATAAALGDLKHDKRSGGGNALEIGGPTGDVTLFVIERSGQVALRGKDKQSPTRLNFKGIESFPIDAAYCVDALYVPFAGGAKLVPHPNKIGLVDMEKCPGALEFSFAGTKYSLEVIDEDGSDSEWFVIFKDLTSGSETYGMRYVYADRPPAGTPGATVKLDFNKAYNPPCSFTPYATCPLAQKQNRLPFRVEAGEKLYNPDAH